MSQFADILLTQKIGNLGSTLTYKIPENLSLKAGDIVELPLRNKPTKGLVLSTHNQSPSFQTKEISNLFKEIGLHPWQLPIMQWMSDYYHCPLNKILPCFVPKKFLKIQKRPRPLKEKTPSDTLNASTKTLTSAQQEAFDAIVASTSSDPFLLHGVTGSGKTEIYLKLAEKNAKEGTQTLILVPEISLTPQTVAYFESSFPEQISIIHSRLSEGKKAQAWKDIHEGTSKIIIGSRSSIFAPFKNLGMIIIDEEHESSYKQEQAPRYHARNVAEKITETLNIPLVLGSATPSVETYYQAEQKNYTLLELPHRVSKNPLPHISLIDLRDELKKKNFSSISEKLQEKIQEKLLKQEQVILFLNKRGSSSSLLCRDCGETAQCHHCDISMTYHHRPSFQSNPALLCHHCGLILPPPDTCKNCKGSNIKFTGAGTQKVETELQQLFPHARVLRADKDTTSKKDGFEKIYKAFKNHEADILIGTQMIAKGLHLPKVNLVGIILADIGLHIPDFRSSERCFQLLTQVAGRAGRSHAHGEVLIQTYNPEHVTIQLAQNGTYLPFYQNEIEIREQFPYPPFSTLIKLHRDDDTAKEGFRAAKILKEKLKAHSNEHTTISLYPAMIHRKNKKYRWCILLNGPSPGEILKHALPLESGWMIDVNPLQTG